MIPNQIKSVGYTNDEVIRNILELYVPEGHFDLDPTYSKGFFYRNLPQPTLKFDVYPQTEGVQQADCRHLPLDDSSIGSMMFDPPFIIRVPNNKDNSLINERFGSFRRQEDLIDMYSEALDEFKRILRPKGILVFKCQDATYCNSQFLVHCEVAKLAMAKDFKTVDLFILINKARMTGGLWKKQHHARKHHSYFYVFQKNLARRSRDVGHTNVSIGANSLVSS